MIALASGGGPRTTTSTGMGATAMAAITAARSGVAVSQATAAVQREGASGGRRAALEPGADLRGDDDDGDRGEHLARAAEEAELAHGVDLRERRARRTRRPP